MPEERHVYLYRINCTINDKNYIGQAFNPKRRWLSHKNEARKEKPALVVEHVMKKHGIENFSFEIIATSKIVEDANETEPVLIIQWDSHVSNGNGYNVATGGKNAPRTAEWKENNSAFMIRRHAENGHPMQGKHHTDETKAKMSASTKGRKRSPESIEKGKQTCIDPERDIAMIQAYQDEVPISEMRQIFKVGNGLIYRMLDRHGIPRRENRRNNMLGKTHSAASINKMSKKKTEWWRIKRENKEEEHPTSG